MRYSALLIIRISFIKTSLCKHVRDYTLVFFYFYYFLPQSPEDKSQSEVLNLVSMLSLIPVAVNHVAVQLIIIQHYFPTFF